MVSLEVFCNGIVSHALTNEFHILNVISDRPALNKARTVMKILLSWVDMVRL